jgi:hypothetical protein
VVPLALQPRLLPLEHFQVSAGHSVISQMIRSLRRRFFGPKMALDVTDTVMNCTTCANNEEQGEGTLPVELLEAISGHAALILRRDRHFGALAQARTRESISVGHERSILPAHRDRVSSH